MGERPQEGAQGRGSTDFVEHDTVSGMPQPVDVVDRVRPSHHPGQQRHHLGSRVRPRAVGRAGDRHVLGDQLWKADLLGQRDHRHQSGIGDEIRIVERDIHRRGGMG